MQFGNAVDRMRTDDAQIRHADLAICDNRHAAYLIPAARKTRPCLVAEPAVDLTDDLIHARKF